MQNCSQDILPGGTGWLPKENSSLQPDDHLQVAEDMKRKTHAVRLEKSDNSRNYQRM